jgi:hypothetical protein
MIQATKKLFKTIERTIDGAFNIIDETLNWSDELVKESKAARKELADERTKQLETLTNTNKTDKVNK